MKQLNKSQRKLTKHQLWIAGGIVVAVVVAAVVWMNVHKPTDLTTEVEPIRSSKSLQSSREQLDANARADQTATQQDQDRLDSVIQ